MCTVTALNVQNSMVFKDFKTFIILFPDPLFFSEGSELASDGSELARFFASKFGGRMLLDKDGHVFVSNKKRGSKVYWNCCRWKSHKCPARASTNDNYVNYWKESHNHENLPYNPNRFT